MVLVFGVDVPLIELFIGFSIISFLLLIEVIVVLFLLMKKLQKEREAYGIMLDAVKKELDAVRMLLKK